MILTLDLGSSRPLFSQIVDGVKRSLMKGTIRAGDPLPPGRDLAASLDVSLETVQRAYRALADEGIVTSRVGRGTRIADTIDLDRLDIDSAVQELVARARRSGVARDQLLDMIGRAYTA